MPYKDIEKRRASARKTALKFYHNNKELMKKRHKNWREDIKRKVLLHYGNGDIRCACCGDNTPEFMTIDHINNDGVIQRKLYTNGGHHNYRFLIKSGLPEGYRILCYNCNCGRARTKDKICPHEKNKNKKTV